MKILKSYILKEHIPPFFISLMVVTFVLLSDRIIDLLNMIIEKKLPLWIVVKMFALSMPYMLALSIPMAVLVATILAFGRMSVDREIVAIKSSGVNVYAMIGPLLAAAVMLTGLMVYFNHWFLPNTNHKLKNLMLEIAYYKPMTIIKANEFTTFMNYTVFAKENNDSLLTDVLIYDRSQSRFPRTVFAKTGNVVQMDNGNSLQIVLNNGEMHERNEREPGKYQKTSFSRYVINVRDLGNSTDFFETGYRSDREMTYPQLMLALNGNKKELSQKTKEVKDLERRIYRNNLKPYGYTRDIELRRLLSMKQIASSRLSELNDNIGSMEVEVHKKFAISFAIIIFIMVGIPLGLMTRTSGIGMAFSVSAVIFLIYYVSLNGGEQLADKGLMPASLAMWMSNIVFFILSLLLINASIKEKRILDIPTILWRMKNLRNRKTPPPEDIVH